MYRESSPGGIPVMHRWGLLSKLTQLKPYGYGILGRNSTFF